MKLSRFVVGALLCIAIPIAFAQQPTNQDPKVAFERYKLDNGLEVILIPDKTVPLVAVSVWYHVGSGYEVHGKSGFAHLFEHMVFQGSKHTGKDVHFPILKKIGADPNGSTTPDRTNYFEVVPSHHLETAIWLESDRMGYLLEMLDKASLDNQIDVVRNERRQRYDNVAYANSSFALYALLFPEGHPYRYLTIGKHEDLESASLDDVKGFFKTWYVPANATLTLAGDFEVPAAKKLVEKWFNTFPKSAKPKVVPVPPTPVKPAEKTITDKFAKLRRITFAWHSPANFGPDDAELDIAANALTRQGPGRLYKALVYDRPLAQNVFASQSGYQFSGVFTITVDLRTEANMDEVRKIVAQEIARLVKEPVTDKEINRYVVGVEASAIRRLETLLGRTETLQSYNHYLGDPDKISWDLDRYRKTSSKAITAAVVKHLVPDRMVTVITMPEEANREGNQK